MRYHHQKSLEEIRARCKECQFLAPKPYVMKFAVSDNDLKFKSEVILEIMYTQDRIVLYGVDRAMEFQAARFLDYY